MIEVVTVWAPRPDNKKWRHDYGHLLKLQRKSVNRVGHRHVIIGDSDHKGPDAIRVTLPHSLMKAILTGQIAYVEQHWDESRPLVLADIDCLILRDLSAAFDGTFDVLLTCRQNDVSPIQNGAMYFAAGSRAVALALLYRALELCGDHWGGDQEAISAAVAPVPMPPDYGVQERFGGRIFFAPCDPYNHSPKFAPVKHTPARFISHFKGDTKIQAAEHARHLGITR